MIVKEKKVKKMEKDMENIDRLDDKKVCVLTVNENIRRVELGMELTQSLASLNSECDFRKKFTEKDRIIHKIFLCYGCYREIKKKGYCSDECRDKHKKLQREWRQKNKDRLKKKRLKRYREDEDFREKSKEYTKKWIDNNRERHNKRVRDYYKIRYHTDPEFRKRKIEAQKRYYLKKKRMKNENPD